MKLVPDRNSSDQKVGEKQDEIAERQLNEEEKREGDKEPTQSQLQEMEPRGDEKVPNTGTAEGALPPGETGELYSREGHGKWGNLPKRAIEEMYDNGNRKLPEKYRIILEEYWRRLPKQRSE